jgi:hypothetical protein
MTLDVSAADLLDRLRAEAARPESERGSGASTTDLLFIADCIAAWLADKNPNHLTGIARMVVDTWSLRDRLAEDVVALEHRARARL